MSIAIPARMSGLSSALAVELGRPAHDRSVRVAEHDARAHRDELVDEEQPVLEHLLEDHDRAVGLGRDGRGDAGEVGRERRPGAVVDLRDGVALVGLDREASWSGGTRSASPSISTRIPSRSKVSLIIRMSDARTSVIVMSEPVTAARPRNDATSM